MVGRRRLYTDARTRKKMTQKNPTLIRTSGSLDHLRARRYAAEPNPVVLTYICAWADNAHTGDEVIICGVVYVCRHERTGDRGTERKKKNESVGGRGGGVGSKYTYVVNVFVEACSQRKSYSLPSTL